MRARLLEREAQDLAGEPPLVGRRVIIGNFDYLVGILGEGFIAQEVWRCGKSLSRKNKGYSRTVKVKKYSGLF
jgi:hypothetical protein